ncbi:hypothetical protein ACFWDI_24540 [Streptomyces sp. NPDC060064]|uniref:hypothetical protein n=1 Tax=Streptomyces sp. NPDC060064 TaxID=3347049 RepID=UPI00368824F6
MGMGITVLVVDWSHLSAIAADERMRQLEDAGYQVDDVEDIEEGWRWPSGDGDPWFGTYEFRSTLGSFKPHFWAGEAWDDVRAFADPALKAALDRFLTPLFWDDATCDDDAEAQDEARDGMDPLRRHLLVTCTPEAVEDLVDAWNEAAPLLAQLREPYAGHAARPGRWIANFEEFSDLLHGWAEVAMEAERRGWGLVGLRA